MNEEKKSIYEEMENYFIYKENIYIDAILGRCQLPYASCHLQGGGAYVRQILDAIFIIYDKTKSCSIILETTLSRHVLSAEVNNIY